MMLARNRAPALSRLDHTDLASPTDLQKRETVVRIFASDHAAETLRELDAACQFDALFPEMTAARGVDQPPNHHYYDVFDHSIETVAALDALLASDTPREPRARLLRNVLLEGLDEAALRDYFDATVGLQTRRVLIKLAGLLHDVAKPETKTRDATGRVRFLGHPEIGAERTEEICARLGFGQDETSFVALLVDEHLRPVQLASPGMPPTSRAIWRFFRDLGDAAPACLILALADGIAAVGPRRQPEQWRPRVDHLRWLLQQAAQPAATQTELRLVTGNDLIEALSLESGRVVGRLLAAIAEAIAAGEVETRDEGISFGRKLLETWQSDAAETTT